MVDLNLVKSLTCPNQSMTKGKDLKAKARKFDTLPSYFIEDKTQKCLSASMTDEFA